MVIEIKKLNPNAKFPKKAYEGDFCYDIYATSRENAVDDDGNVMENVYVYGTGLSFRIVRDEIEVGEKIIHENMSLCSKTVQTERVSLPIDNLYVGIDVRPRSSIYKTGLVLCNTPGTIDEKYRGEIKCIFRHVDKSLPIYEVGERVAQICVSFTVPIDFKEVEGFDEKDNTRGEKGLGSSNAIEKFKTSPNVHTQIYEDVNGVHELFVKDGWILNPNEKVVSGILKGIARKNGLCPCHHEDNWDLQCPCESYREHDKCCCNLYIKPINGFDDVSIISLNRGRLGKAIKNS